MALLVVTAEGITDAEMTRLMGELRGLEFVDHVLTCTDEQAQDVRRTVGW